MQKTSVILIATLLLFLPITTTEVALISPIPTVAAQTAEAATPEAVDQGAAYPARVVAPSIKLDSAVIPMGLTSSGDLAVPDGKTNNVGWYAAGTIPGNTGSAVFDAHVFAAFKNLDKLSVGSDIFVTTRGGDVLHFKVESAVTYPLAEVPAGQLYNKIGGNYLNLITCAGKLTADHSTYDHRLIVYAVLVS